MTPISRSDLKAILGIVEEGILLDGFLKGAGMDPFDQVFSWFANNPIIETSPNSWMPSFFAWLILFLAVVLILIFARALGIVALLLAFVSGLFFHANLTIAEWGLVMATVIGLWATYRHVYTRANPWWF